MSSSNELEILAAADIVRILDLAPHPEGGFYRETFRDALTNAEGRSASTSIYFLLPAGEVSAWHRVDAVEIWHFYAGRPLLLSLYPVVEALATHVLGPDLAGGERPQCVVPAGIWQMAECPLRPADGERFLPAWTLVGCTVAPGFSFSGFELAPAGWQP